MLRHKKIMVMIVLASVFAFASAHAEVVASRLIAFDSFVRIPFPAKVRAEIISENPAASRQILKLSRGLKAPEREEIEKILEESGHLRSVRWNSPNELALEYRSVRATSVELTPDLWAAVVKRPSSFPFVDVFGQEACIKLFPKNQLPVLRTQVESLCSGSREWLPKPGALSALSRSEEYVADVLRLFTLPQLPNADKLAQWAAESDGNAEDQVSVMFLQAAALIYAGDDVMGLQELAKMSGLPHLSDEARAMIALIGEATFERAVENRCADDQAEAARAVWRQFNRWDSASIDFENKMILANWFRESEEFELAITQLQHLLARGYENDLRVLELLATVYKESGQDYRAFATLRFIAEMR